MKDKNSINHQLQLFIICSSLLLLLWNNCNFDCKIKLSVCFWSTAMSSYMNHHDTHITHEKTTDRVGCWIHWWIHSMKLSMWPWAKTNNRKFTQKSAATHPTVSKHTNRWLLITEWANEVLRGYLRIAFASRKLKTHYSGLGTATMIPLKLN